MSNSFELNLKRNLEALMGDSKYQTIQENDPLIWRFAPPLEDAEGLIFYTTYQTYNIKDPENPTGRTIALADLNAHGNDETGYVDYPTKFREILKEQGNEEERAAAKKINRNKRHYAQGWACIDPEQNRWSKIRLLALSPTTAKKVIKIIDNQRKMNQPEATDPETGQALIITREGSGLSSKYDIDRSGVQVSLPEIIPDWKSQMYKEVYKKLDLRIMSYDEQRQHIMLTFPNLDWERLTNEFSL